VKLAIVGLGRMGANLARRLARAGHEVLAVNRTVQVAYDLAEEEAGIAAVVDVRKAVAQLSPPRVVWVMVPAGDSTDQVLADVARHLSHGDVLIDGGNSNYRDTLRRGKHFEALGIHFLDVGVSGGVWGLSEGFCLMIGGLKEDVVRLAPIFASLAPSEDAGWGWVGPTGAGHFVKMVHNGIEYGLMEAYAEGFEILRGKEEFGVSLPEVAEIWSYGSVVRSWLLELVTRVLKRDPSLAEIAPWVADSGEGRWTVTEAIDQQVPAPIITLSLLMRFASRQEDRYAARLLAAMRKEFGGHETKSAS
jgi:6-phosphogluconate dehydrogenase